MISLTTVSMSSHDLRRRAVLKLRMYCKAPLQNSSILVSMLAGRIDTSNARWPLFFNLRDCTFLMPSSRNLNEEPIGTLSIFTVLGSSVPMTCSTLIVSQNQNINLLTI